VYLQYLQKLQADLAGESEGMMTLSLRRLLPIGQRNGLLEMIQYPSLANSAYGILFTLFSLDANTTKF
jgi:hypothetical protein